MATNHHRGQPFMQAQDILPIVLGAKEAVRNNNLNANGEDEAIDENMETLTDEQLLLTSCMVKGYSMKAKRWGEYALLLTFLFPRDLCFTIFLALLNPEKGWIS